MSKKKQRLIKRLSPENQLLAAAVHHYHAAEIYEKSIGTPKVRQAEQEERISYKVLWNSIERFVKDLGLD